MSWGWNSAGSGASFRWLLIQAKTSVREPESKKRMKNWREGRPGSRSKGQPVFGGTGRRRQRPRKSAASCREASLKGPAEELTHSRPTMGFSNPSYSSHYSMQFVFRIPYEQPVMPKLQFSQPLSVATSFDMLGRPFWLQLLLTEQLTSPSSSSWHRHHDREKLKRHAPIPLIREQ